nr:MAG TPA: hypothetical protein [Caudoviricetes sp.]
MCNHVQPNAHEAPESLYLSMVFTIERKPRKTSRIPYVVRQMCAGKVDTW